MEAADRGATDCLRLLLARGGAALELDAQRNDDGGRLCTARPGMPDQKLCRCSCQRARTPPSATTRTRRPSMWPGSAQQEAEEDQWRGRGEGAGRFVRRPAGGRHGLEPECPRLLLRARALIDAARTSSHRRAATTDCWKPGACRWSAAGESTAGWQRPRRPIYRGGWRGGRAAAGGSGGGGEEEEEAAREAAGLREVRAGAGGRRRHGTRRARARRRRGW